MTASKEKLFTPAKLTSQQKIAQTDSTARKIIEAEVVAREKKTEKLRKLRLEQEALAALEPAPEPTAKARKKKS